MQYKAQNTTLAQTAAFSNFNKFLKNWNGFM